MICHRQSVLHLEVSISQLNSLMTMNIQNDLEQLFGYVNHYGMARAQYFFVLSQSTLVSTDFLDEAEALFNQILVDLNACQWKVNEWINSWKKDQQKSIISDIIDNNVLHLIGQYNTNLIKFMQMVDEDLNKFLSNATVKSDLDKEIKLISYSDNLKKLMNALLENALIVLEQPCSSIMRHDPLTIISNAKFDVKLTILLDYQMISNNYSLQIDIKLLKEEELFIVLNQGLSELLKGKPSFNIINKTDPIYTVENSMIYISITGMLKVDINRRGHNPKALPVAEEKFKFLFNTNIELLGNHFSSHTFSFPVNVLSRKDYRNSYATILWDNAFPIENRQMFETREEVHWSELGAVLAAKFNKDVGVPLLSSHLDFISKMIPNLNNTGIVTWEQFARVCLPKRQFTFFEWFYKTLTLVREQLLDMYRDGLIHGFISSESSEILLNNCVDGTFLIRFSETFCGAISIAYIKDRKFSKLFPWDLDRLRKISMSHTIKCTDFLLYLYPNYPKDEMFCKYYVLTEVPHSITQKDYNSDTNIAQVIHSQGSYGQ